MGLLARRGAIANAQWNLTDYFPYTAANVKTPWINASAPNGSPPSVTPGAAVFTATGTLGSAIILEAGGLSASGRTAPVGLLTSMMVTSCTTGSSVLSKIWVADISGNTFNLSLTTGPGGFSHAFVNYNTTNLLSQSITSGFPFIMTIAYNPITGLLAWGAKGLNPYDPHATDQLTAQGTFGHTLTGMDQSLYGLTSGQTGAITIGWAHSRAFVG